MNASSTSRKARGIPGRALALTRSSGAGPLAISSAAFLALSAAASLALPASISAQGGGPGFLFGDPDVSFGFRVGYGIPTVSSDLFDETFETFTLAREDFRGATLGGEVAVHVNERWDVALSALYHGRRMQSEYMEFYEEDPNDPAAQIPILHETWFRTVPVTVSARYYFVDRGRSIGRFAWVPARFTPFVSAGAGVVAWRFEQSGDFVDEETLLIFTDRISASGTGPYLHAGGGASLSLTKNLVLSLEGRYGWGRGDLEPEFGDYEDLDLSGLQLLAGISARF